MDNSKKDESSKSEKIFDIRFLVIALLFGFISLIIFSLPWFFIKDAWIDRLAFDAQTGFIGDSIGGMLGPFVATLAAFLTFLAFWMQYKANKAQTKQFEDQANDIAIDRFETKFYQLINIHRDNVKDLSVGGSHIGKKAFVQYFHEIKFCYYLMEDYIQLVGKNKVIDADQIIVPIEEKIKASIAYLVFFLGVNDNPNSLLIQMLNKVCQQKFSEGFVNYILENITLQYTAGAKTFETTTESIVFRATYYCPCSGHYSDLGVYFRHLFHAVKYVDKTKFLEEPSKFNYVRTLRAQLTDYEQILLHFNCLSPLGWTWVEEENNFIHKYRLIKNIPLPAVSFGPNLKMYYSKEIQVWAEKGDLFFEWGDQVLVKDLQ